MRNPGLALEDVAVMCGLAQVVMTKIHVDFLTSPWSSSSALVGRHIAASYWVRGNEEAWLRRHQV